MLGFEIQAPGESSVMSLSYTFLGMLGFGMQAPVIYTFKIKLRSIVYKKGGPIAWDSLSFQAFTLEGLKDNLGYGNLSKMEFLFDNG